MPHPESSSKWFQMYYSNASEKKRNKHKNRTENVILKKQFLLFLRFRTEGKEQQEIHFTNANTNNEKV